MTTKRNDRSIDAASLDLEAIKARAAAATEGPWEWDNPTIGQHWSRPEPWATVVDDEVNCGGYCYGGSSSPIKSDADGQFIAHAREDVPALVAEVERLQAKVAAFADIEEAHNGSYRMLRDQSGMTELVAEVERLRAQPTITDEMFTRGALAMHEPTDERLAELRKIAEETRPGGGWTADVYQVNDEDGHQVYGADAYGDGTSPAAEHIAAFDPPTVLALLAELGEARQRLAKVERIASGSLGLPVYRVLDAVVRAVRGEQ